QDYGVRRLWKVLRHETPGPAETASRLGIDAAGEPLAQVFKTYHLPHTGKLSLSRIWRGPVSEGMVLNGTRVGGVVRLLGGLHDKVVWGQGDVHLQIAIHRLRNRHNLAVVGHHAAVPYKETIRRATQQHSRFKRQSGGHGQFADCTIDVKPLPRGSGFTFTD